MNENIYHTITSQRQEQRTKHVSTYFLLYNTSVLITAMTNSDKSSSQDRHQVAAILEAVEQTFL
jgi:hypothetical protein